MDISNWTTPASTVVTNAVGGAREWKLAQKELCHVPIMNQQHKPVAPPLRDTSRCFSDAEWSNSSLKAGIGWIISAESLEGSTMCSFVSSPFIAETLVL
ncbi:hypothetical protein F2Q69_00010086 [Brassica cretica]|uniref:RNase H type-1 domain-containing protein n=1 Tax=Brassica cretica TaxID=69181 RepID=A0A8S9P5W7_BRACR|nr:hypothetical protein F2Q69_00010086 [Brassica cretica]